LTSACYRFLTALDLSTLDSGRCILRIHGFQTRGEHPLPSPLVSRSSFSWSLTQLSTFRHTSRALATTVLLAILALVSSTTFLIPNKLNAESSSLKINGLNVVKGVNQYERSAKAREYAFVKFDLRTGQFALSGLQEESSGRKAKLTTVLSDLRPLFNWNTKQVFVSLVADYSTPSYVSSASLGVSSLRRNILER